MGRYGDTATSGWDPKPRLFRLSNRKALINRMGFNNKGVDYLVRKLKAPRMSEGVIGVNVGKNKTTPNERAADDYKTCITKVYPYADYITVNISSPNTPGLRDLQRADELGLLLKELNDCRQQLINQHRQTALFLKITVDVSNDELSVIVDQVKRYQFDGIISSNTTLERALVKGHRNADEQGGVSGKPLTRPSILQMRRLSESAADGMSLIGVGGISSLEDALEQKKPALVVFKFTAV